MTKTKWDMNKHISYKVSSDYKQIEDAYDGVYTHYYFNTLNLKKINGL